MHVRWLLGFATVALTSGCCGYPKAEPATGTEGVWIRAIPGDVQAAVVAAPAPGSSLGWPPTRNGDPAAPCTDEVERVTSSLGVAPIACPTIQRAEVPGQVNGDDPIPKGGFDLTCFDSGGTLVVLEHTVTLSPRRCTHVVGVALFHSSGR